VVKIAFYEIEEWEEPLLRKAFSDCEIQFFEEKLNDKTVGLAKDAEALSIMIWSHASREVLSQMPNLKFIATRSVGFDHIDLNYCKEKGVVVSNIPKYGGDTVAQHAIALILAISRNLIPSVERTRKGNFSLDGLRGFDLAGKTLGVIGAGHIGKKVIELALCFGMKIAIFTKTKDEELAKNPKVSFVDLDTLLGQSDVITLHAPHTKETEHIINMQNVEKIKKGAILINTSRGPLIETQAILEGLEKGILKGAGLDVLEEECSLREERELLTGEFLKSCDIKTQLLNHVLLTRNDVVVTPHNAFNSNEALKEIIDITIENIKHYLSGQLQNKVD